MCESKLDRGVLAVGHVTGLRVLTVASSTKLDHGVLAGGHVRFHQGCDHRLRGGSLVDFVSAARVNRHRCSSVQVCSEQQFVLQHHGIWSQWRVDSQCLRVSP